MRKINRRNFLKVTGVLAAASALAACGGSSTSTAGWFRCQRRRCKGLQ